VRTLLTASAFLLALAPAARADVRLPSVFGSHMVLQRDKPIVIFGQAEPGEKVAVSLGDDKGDATANPQGAWKVTFPARKASDKGVTLKVECDGSSVTHTDILVGDVWVGSGQSNMEWSLSMSGNPRETIAASSHPLIRLYHVPKLESPILPRDIPASWRVCSPKSSPDFSAVLYHFGVNIQKEIGVPVGLINSSWGGSAIEPWMASSMNPKSMQSGLKYNAMIAPIRQFPIKGVIWYQGESNMAEGMVYRDKKARLISDWRKFWGDDMPFYFVQIAPWSKYGSPKLPELWEAQCACLKIPGTGMAVTTDLVDDIGDIHPKNKTDVGQRLARWALNRTYGKKDVVVSGPLFKSLKIDGDRAIVSFAHTAGGLRSRDEKPLTEFEIAGEDGKFVAAEAKIDGERVIVSSKEVTNPTQVRFGWRNVCNPNLCNKEGLPASPFRSKDWKGGTGVIEERASE
jgi:sialate O-acetylesterase